MIANAARPDAGFLESLAAYRIFDRLARLHEAGQAGIHALLEMMTAPEQAAIPFDIDRQHDDDRIGDRKSVVEGKRVSVRVNIGGRRIIKKKKTTYLRQKK